MTSNSNCTMLLMDSVLTLEFIKSNEVMYKMKLRISEMRHDLHSQSINGIAQMLSIINSSYDAVSN